MLWKLIDLSDKEFVMKKKNFNMIEIMLAMIVIAVGFISVLGLLPTGLLVTREAQENTYVTLAAETMRNYLRGELERYDLSRWAGTGNYASKCSYFSVDHGYRLATKGEIAGDELASLELPAPIDYDEGRFGSKVLIPDPDGKSNGIPSNFTLIQSSRSGDIYPKFHYMKWSTDIKGEKVVDFDCITSVGMTYVRDTSRSANGVRIEEGEGTVRLAIRVEWPAMKKAGERKFREFLYYVF